MSHFFISAGESSGDLHASELIDRITRITGVNTSFTGLGGDEMIRKGLDKLYHISELSATGYTEVIKKLPFFRKVLDEASKFIIKNKPSAVILVDYPGFNLRLASKIRTYYKGKIIYYISPQLWAWRVERIKKIKDLIDKMLVIFPFEVNFYSRYGIQAIYVGHPLTSRLKDIRHSDKIPPREYKLITLMPGSREEEIRHHMPILYKTLEELGKNYKIKACIIKPPHISNSFYKNEKRDIDIVTSDKYHCLSISDAVLSKAGTSTLECTLIGVPHLIFYKTGFLNYFLLKPQAKVQNMGIANIISGKNIVREFIQSDFTSHNLKDETLRLLGDNEYIKTMKEEFNEVRKILGSGEASEHAALEILKTIE